MPEKPLDLTFESHTALALLFLSVVCIASVHLNQAVAENLLQFEVISQLASLSPRLEPAQTQLHNLGEYNYALTIEAMMGLGWGVLLIVWPLFCVVVTVSAYLKYLRVKGEVEYFNKYGAEQIKAFQITTILFVITISALLGYEFYAFEYYYLCEEHMCNNTIIGAIMAINLSFAGFVLSCIATNIFHYMYYSSLRRLV